MGIFPLSSRLIDRQISYWCSIQGHEYFTEVPESFIEDQFNLTGLNAQVPFYTEAMSMILDGEYGSFLFPPSTHDPRLR